MTLALAICTITTLVTGIASILPYRTFETTVSNLAAIVSSLIYLVLWYETMFTLSKQLREDIRQLPTADQMRDQIRQAFAPLLTIEQVRQEIASLPTTDQNARGATEGSRASCINR
jgi:uncharacterized protein YybS (DUF2232 family)